jgi:hypothetical protein
VFVTFDLRTSADAGEIPRFVGAFGNVRVGR